LLEKEKSKVTQLDNKLRQVATERDCFAKKLQADSGDANKVAVLEQAMSQFMQDADMPPSSSDGGGLHSPRITTLTSLNPTQSDREALKTKVDSLPFESLFS
jgi:hypothetical protein